MTDSEIIAVVTAHKEGKQIQHRLNDNTEGNPSEREWKDVEIGYAWPWNFLERDYRVKPEPRKPREWWIEIQKENLADDAWRKPMLTPDGKPVCKTIHVREVLE